MAMWTSTTRLFLSLNECITPKFRVVVYVCWANTVRFISSIREWSRPRCCVLGGRPLDNSSIQLSVNVDQVVPDAGKNKQNRE